MRSRKTVKILAAVAAVAAAASTGGCNVDPTKGYTLISLYPKDVRTVHVPIWVRGKDVYDRELEFQLTEALTKRIQAETQYRLAPRSQADTILTGTIEGISQQVLSFNPDTGRPNELEVTMVVSFVWKDLRSGQVRKERTNFRAVGTYIPPEPFAEEFFQGSQEVINRMAERIVEQMEADW